MPSPPLRIGLERSEVGGVSFEFGDDFSSNRHPALSFCLNVISAQTPLAFVARENRCPLFRIML
jgi:hypothetical protein